MEHEKNEKIVVFQRFSNYIEANLAKAKLDAHGIPCFLTEENFSTLYPSTHLIDGGVRLHIFEHDRDRTAEILLEDLSPDEGSPREDAG